MINLLPPDVKEDYSYALRNTALRRWVIAMGLGIVGLGLIATFGLATLQHSTSTYNRQVSAAQDNLGRQKLKQTEAQVTDISNSFKLAVQVLSKEVLFSKLLKQIATVTPSNVNLIGLNISQTTGAIDISAAASDYNTATQVQVNLADPANKIFSKADIVSITCSTSPSDPKHPCTVLIRALFSTKNPFLFINNTGGQ
jgi:Tfp pilus assembly protein PilN